MGGCDEEEEEEEERGGERGERKYNIINCGAHICKIIIVESLTLIFQVFGTFPVLDLLPGTYI